MLAVASLFAATFVVRGTVAFQPPKGAFMQITSTAFTNNQPIPPQYTCAGKNISPPLKWTGAPAGTKSFVLICNDPDAPAGDWVHWVVFDLPAGTTELPEDVAKSQFIAGNAKQGLNDFKHLGYGGPCPPAGKPHHYIFRLYALNAMLDLPPGAKKQDVEVAMARHIIGQGELVGIYQRK